MPEETTCTACCEGWVCEKHPDQPWRHRIITLKSGGEDCSGPGMPCRAVGCKEGEGLLRAEAMQHAPQHDCRDASQHDGTAEGEEEEEENKADLEKILQQAIYDLEGLKDDRFEILHMEISQSGEVVALPSNIVMIHAQTGNKQIIIIINYKDLEQSQKFQETIAGGRLEGGAFNG